VSGHPAAAVRLQSLKKKTEIQFQQEKLSHPPAIILSPIILHSQSDRAVRQDEQDLQDLRVISLSRQKSEIFAEKAKTHAKTQSHKGYAKKSVSYSGVGGIISC